MAKLPVLQSIEDLSGEIGVLPTLKTTNKENLVGAINESVDEITALQGATVGLGFSSSCVDLNSKNITDVHNLITTSYRRCFGNDLINAPSTGFYFYDIKVHSTGFATITAQGFGYGGAIKATFTKECLGGEWQKWERQATTDKIDISLTPLTGISILHQDNYVMNGELFINIQIAKSDSSLFSTGGYSVATIPSSVTQTVSLSCSGLNSSGAIVQSGGSILEDWNKKIQCYVNDSTTKYVSITGKARLT